MAQVRLRFPQYLSQPAKVLWWDMDVFMIFAVFFMLALILGFRSATAFVICVSLAVLVPYFYSKIKKKYPRGFFRYILYMLGLVRLKRYPDFFIDFFEE